MMAEGIILERTDFLKGLILTLSVDTTEVNLGAIKNIFPVHSLSILKVSATNLKTVVCG